MPGIVEIGGSIISKSVGEAEVASQNIANMNTFGYRNRRAFSQELLISDQNNTVDHPVFISYDFTGGRLVTTGAPLDLAIVGDGFFAVRSGGQILYTRNGQFSRDSEGRLVAGGDMIVQSGAGDVYLDTGAITVSSDGMLIQDGAPAAKLSIMHFDDPAQLKAVGESAFAAVGVVAKEMADPVVKQGMLESSNVSSATEMVMLMGAIRKAESGQRIVQVYDDLMSKALTIFGQVQ